ncbi:hypothetical protein niasHS_016721 [Heterodera schachtii]|uniref:Uncharacterized protein n=1 Tax=Heterodera schachtii TaxID=97005 RepID=A0ABD2HUC3_HETSC
MLLQIKEKALILGDEAQKAFKEVQKWMEKMGNSREEEEEKYKTAGLPTIGGVKCFRCNKDSQRQRALGMKDSRHQPALGTRPRTHLLDYERLTRLIGDLDRTVHIDDFGNGPANSDALGHFPEALRLRPIKDFSDGNCCIFHS